VVPPLRTEWVEEEALVMAVVVVMVEVGAPEDTTTIVETEIVSRGGVDEGWEVARVPTGMYFLAKVERGWPGRIERPKSDGKRTGWILS
jgi:hypothetical protein